VGVAEDIVISMVVFLFLSLRNTDGTVIQGANSVAEVGVNTVNVLEGLKGGVVTGFL
jgi:hypothetical protein